MYFLNTTLNRMDPKWEEAFIVKFICTLVDGPSNSKINVVCVALV